MKNLIRCLVLATIVFFCVPVSAQANLMWTSFTRENSDIPGDMIKAVAFGEDGSLWVGTESGGLARLDRQGHWEVYTRASTNGGLSNDHINTLAFGHGILWVGTESGLARLDRQGHWQEALPGHSIAALALGQDGTLWVGTSFMGLFRLDPQGHWQVYTQVNTKADLTHVAALALGQDGTLWVGFDSGFDAGLARLDPQGHWQCYTQAYTKPGLPNWAISALALGQDGTLWVGTGSGLARRDRQGRWQYYAQPSTKGGLQDSIAALALGNDGALWVGTLGGGLARLDRQGQWQDYTQTNTNGGLSNDDIAVLAIGPDGTLWVGTYNGLSRLDRQINWQDYTHASTHGALPNDDVTALAWQGGTLWVRTGIDLEFATGSGLERLDHQGRWQDYTLATSTGNVLNLDNYVSTLALGQDGTLWVGIGSGLARRDRQGRWQYFTQANTKGGLPSDRIRALALGHEGTLWVGTDSGLARLDPQGHWQYYRQANTKGGLPDDSISALTLGQHETLWVGTDSGSLARLDRQGHWQDYTLAFINGSMPSQLITALRLDQDGTLWVGSDGYGLARLDLQGSWQYYTYANTKGGLPQDSIAALALGQDGSLWVGTNGAGLARLDLQGHWQDYTQANTNGGLPNDKIYTLALGHDGTLWIGTAGGGLSRFIHPSQPALQITDVLGETGNVAQANETIAVVAFDASYLTSPEMFHYAWTLGKSDSSPSLAPETITKSPFYRVHFTSAGHYQLQVVAIDRYGNRSESKTIAYNYIPPKPPNFWERLISAWPVITGIFTALYTASFVMLLVLTKRHAWAFRLICDAAWAKWLTWPFFFLRNVYAVQLWVLTPWFNEISSRIRNNGRFVDPPVSCAEDSPSEGLMLLQRLGAQSRLWLYGRSGMGKSSLFSAWEHAYFSEPSLSIAAKKYGFILVMLPVRDYAMLEAPESNRPESWVLEAVRRRLEQFGFATRDLSLIEAMLRVGKIAIALDGMNEANRGSALDAFSKQFKATRLLVTSQAMPGGNRSAEPSNHWQVWELPKNIGELRSRLLKLWLGETGGAILERRIVAEGLSATLISGYDVRLIADLAEHDPVHAQLPLNRVALYRTILASIIGENGEPLDLEGLKKIAWLMVTQRRRRLQSDDEALLGAGTLHILMGEKVRIVRTIGGEREFRHDQMRAFLAALWLFDETPTITALQRNATDSHAFELNNRDQEELWGFLAALLKSDATLKELWSFANDDPIERFMLIAALQSEADKRGISLLRLARQAN